MWWCFDCLGYHDPVDPCREGTVMANETTRHTDGWDSEGNRRVAVVYIGEDDVLDTVLFNLREQPQIVRKARVVAVPPDAEVIRVCHSWDRRAFGFMLRHDSFAPVPDGCMPPVLDVVTEWEVVDTRSEIEPAVVRGVQ